MANGGENSNEPTGQFTARLPTKVEYNVKQMRQYRSMCLIKARSTAVAILVFGNHNSPYELPCKLNDDVIFEVITTISAFYRYFTKMG